MNGIPSPFAWTSPPALLAPSTISSTAQAALLHSHPPCTPGFAGLCYDCSQCVLHTYLLAPILRWDAHIKECHFQRSRVSHAHKCCPDTWSGKIKTACLPVRGLCGGMTVEAGVSDVLSLFSFPRVSFSTVAGKS